ncbi:MAG TPA: hypothetical protein VHV83_12785 [Armatimonadota bacterium]|nr:hypothetical protein [Armatimonadota bacterium]
MDLRKWSAKIDGQTLVALLLAVWGASGIAYAIIKAASLVHNHASHLLPLSLARSGVLCLFNLAYLVIGIALFRHLRWAQPAAMVLLYLGIVLSLFSLVFFIDITFFHLPLSILYRSLPGFDIYSLLNELINTSRQVLIYFGIILFLRRQRKLDDDF